jgi:hypothetical protein
LPANANVQSQKVTPQAPLHLVIVQFPSYQLHVSQFLEQHVKEIVDEYLAENSPISNHRWGFMHYRSSTSALISVIHDWLSVLDNGHEVYIVFFESIPFCATHPLASEAF